MLKQNMEQAITDAVAAAMEFHMFQAISDDLLVNIRDMVIGQIGSDCELGEVQGVNALYPRVVVDIDFQGDKFVFTFYLQDRHRVKMVRAEVNNTSAPLELPSHDIGDSHA